MNDAKMSRREAGRRTLAVLGAAFVAPAALLGCGEEGGGGGGLTCTDTTGLAPAAVATRESQAYTDTSAHADRKCNNCRFFTAGAANACGTCQVVQGPIHPDGFCNLWAAQA